jgi:lipid II:glycine glycyltransferase (peptidoglycan interpeptide bridge formation enzyme)
MRYKFKLEGQPVKFDNSEVFNSEAFWNYLNKLGVKHNSINIYNEQDEFVAYFITTERKVGLLRFYGSPVRGIGTDFQGITICDEAVWNTIDILVQQFGEFLIKNKFTPFRLLDNQIPKESYNSRIWNVFESNRYILDLTQTEDQIKKGFHYKSATYEINKARKRGLRVEFVSDISYFLDIHYSHLLDVFNRKGLPVPHTKKRLETLFKSLAPHQYLLSITINAEDKVIASNSYLVGKKFAYYYTGSSFSAYFKDSPNELLMGESIIELKSRGTNYLEFGRGMGYKRKYGPIEKQFIEAHTLNGNWKLKLLEFGELKLKSLRKNKIYKRFFASKINRLIHFTN